MAAMLTMLYQLKMGYDQKVLKIELLRWSDWLVVEKLVDVKELLLLESRGWLEIRGSAHNVHQMLGPATLRGQL